mmetsp:Transcript_49570/g.142668  ORF Transcript_49570/g.142668 Transcript_49570/m.142668 type:complete len:219 (+) Transcript_49570:635-1291(+)
MPMSGVARWRRRAYRLDRWRVREHTGEELPRHQGEALNVVGVMEGVRPVGRRPRDRVRPACTAGAVRAPDREVEVPAAAHAIHTEGPREEGGQQPVALGDLLRARAEGGEHVACLQAELRGEGEFHLSLAVLGVDGQDIDTHRFHVPLDFVAKVHALGVLKRGEDVDAGEQRLPTASVFARLNERELLLAADEDLVAMALVHPQLLQHPRTECPRQRS